MPYDSFSSQLKQYRQSSENNNNGFKTFISTSPIKRVQGLIKTELEKCDKYRIAILSKHKTFIGLPEESILFAARCMEENIFKKGDVVIKQDEIGDKLYILEEGKAIVVKKSMAYDGKYVEDILKVLENDSIFGDYALITSDLRSASIIIESNEARVLSLTKQHFDEITQNSKKLQEENRIKIGLSVIESVSFLKNLSISNKKSLVKIMNEVEFNDNSYICRQGNLSTAFFIITEGTCSVTNNGIDSEKEVNTLSIGNFFGEVALSSEPSRRTANVVSRGKVTCLSLNRNDFFVFLKNKKININDLHIVTSSTLKMDEERLLLKKQQHLSDLNNKNMKNNYLLFKNNNKKRVSAFNLLNAKDEFKSRHIFKLMSRFLTEALWNSLYSRMYRELLLNTNKLNEYGKLTSAVMKYGENWSKFIDKAENTASFKNYNSNDITRQNIIKSMNNITKTILEIDPPRRSNIENSFILGLLLQNNSLQNKLCKGWPYSQYAALCKKVKFLHVPAHKLVCEVGSHRTCAFLILKGAVRLFYQNSSTTTNVYRPPPPPPTTIVKDEENIEEEFEEDESDEQDENEEDSNQDSEEDSENDSDEDENEYDEYQVLNRSESKADYSFNDLNENSQVDEQTTNEEKNTDDNNETLVIENEILDDTINNMNSSILDQNNSLDSSLDLEEEILNFSKVKKSKKKVKKIKKLPQLVRVPTDQQDPTSTLNTGIKVSYDSDLFPGDIFGDETLSGVSQSSFSALALTGVDLVVIEVEDFLNVQTKGSLHMNAEDRLNYLLKIPLFQNWDIFKLQRLASSLIQEEIEKNTIITTKNKVNNAIYFILEGKVDVVNSLKHLNNNLSIFQQTHYPTNHVKYNHNHKNPSNDSNEAILKKYSLKQENIITVLNPYDYFGESGFCNRFLYSGSSGGNNGQKNNKKVISEKFYSIASTKLCVLVCHESKFFLFDYKSIDNICQLYYSKIKWRMNRINEIKQSKKIIKKRLYCIKMYNEKTLDYNMNDLQSELGILNSPSFSTLSPTISSPSKTLSSPFSPLNLSSNSDSSFYSAFSPVNISQSKNLNEEKQLWRITHSPSLASSLSPIKNEGSILESNSSFESLPGFSSRTLNSQSTLDPKYSRPVSQSKSRPVSQSYSRPRTQPNQKKTLSFLDSAYMASLVHPLDTKLSDPNAPHWLPDGGELVTTIPVGLAVRQNVQSHLNKASSHNVNSLTSFVKCGVCNTKNYTKICIKCGSILNLSAISQDPEDTNINMSKLDGPTVEVINGKLKNVNQIPTLLTSDLNRFNISTLGKGSKQYEKICDIITELKKAPSIKQAQSNINNAHQQIYQQQVNYHTNSLLQHNNNIINNSFDQPINSSSYLTSKLNNQSSFTDFPFIPQLGSNLENDIRSPSRGSLGVFLSGKLKENTRKNSSALPSLKK